MSEKFFLDTNIFLYVFDDRVPQKSLQADQLVEQALATRKGVISYQVVQEFFNVVLKKLSQPMHLTDAQQYLNDTLIPLLGVHSSTALFREAFPIYGSGGLSWYDSLIVAAALQAKCDVLYTEDLQHGRKFGNLRIANPFL